MKPRHIEAGIFALFLLFVLVFILSPTITANAALRSTGLIVDSPAFVVLIPVAIILIVVGFLAFRGIKHR